jgi:hypothetical protein
MGYHPRIESKDIASFLTTRSRHSRLWFINNPKLEEATLGLAAKYAERYGAKVYGLAIEGNHIHAPMAFPNANRADFARDFNANVARAVARHCPEYEGGSFWERRYSSEFMPDAPDIEKEFFYTVLQAVQDGLVPKISEYPGYNCFHDAIWGIKRRFKVTRWAEYNAARRHNEKVSLSDYTDTITFQYERLPGYEDMTQAEYARMMLDKLERLRVEIVNDRYARGLGFVGRENLLAAIPGSRPKKTKKSTRNSHRPRVLCICPERRAKCLAWYFSVYFEYKDCSKRYRAGEADVKFPEGTYRPYLWNKGSPA